VNRKRIAETHHPDRNRQFEIIALTKKRFVKEKGSKRKGVKSAVDLCQPF
jgi:hypothetical protein